MNRMAKLAGVLAFAVTAGCPGGDDDGGTGPSTSLQGTWRATTWTYVNQANTSQSYNLLTSVTGVQVVMTIGATNYSIAITAPGQTTVTLSGSYTVSGSNFVVLETGSSTPENVPFSRSGNTLTMTSTNSDWDFDNDGTDEAANLNMVFTLQP